MRALQPAAARWQHRMLACLVIGSVSSANTAAPSSSGATPSSPFRITTHTIKAANSSTTPSTVDVQVIENVRTGERVEVLGGWGGKLDRVAVASRTSPTRGEVRDVIATRCPTFVGAANFNCSAETYQSQSAPGACCKSAAAITYGCTFSLAFVLLSSPFLGVVQVLHGVHDMCRDETCLDVHHRSTDKTHADMILPCGASTTVCCIQARC